MSEVERIKESSPEPFNEAQESYLTGFFAGVRQRAVVFSDLFGADPNLGNPAAQKAADEEEPLITEERIKRDEHPLDAYHRIIGNARSGKAPDKDDSFRFKWNGLFFETPMKDAYMARLRIPGGRLQSRQMRELGRISAELTTGYVQITTRANFQIRHISIRNTADVLRRIEQMGLHTRGSGADNIRNITNNPTAGVDPAELIDCTPFLDDLAQIIVSQRRFYDLPRKFNIAFDGGGLVSSAEDTNDIGVKAVKVSATEGGEAVLFRIALGGATGHKKFAGDFGVLVTPEEVVEAVTAIVSAFINLGNRGNRKSARLKHLLEKIGMETFRVEVEKIFGRAMTRSALSETPLVYPGEEISHPQVGAYPQRQPGFHYLGVSVPVGVLTPMQVEQLADLADTHGSGELRLTVWQNIIIPNVPDAKLEALKKAVREIGLDCEQSNIASGVVACTGNRHCKFASTDTKGHALALTKELEKRITLARPVNIHFTGCPNSCAQHYMGDIGLLGTKSFDGEAAYHVFVGGGFGTHQACGRQVYTGMKWTEVPHAVENMLRAWQKSGTPGESFRDFTLRYDLDGLRTLFS